MNRLVAVSVIFAVLAVSGCGEAPRDAIPETQETSEAKRGKHRIRQSSRSGPREVAQTSEIDIPLLNMALLDRDPSSFEVDRDPFLYGRVPRPEPAPTPPPAKKPPREVVKKPTETKPIGPTAPPFVHTYLGSFGSAGLRIAVFEDNEGTIINAFEGEVLESKFKVLKIGYESVDIEFVGFPDTPAERIQIGG